MVPERTLSAETTWTLGFLSIGTPATSFSKYFSFQRAVHAQGLVVASLGKIHLGHLQIRCAKRTLWIRSTRYPKKGRRS